MGRWFGQSLLPDGPQEVREARLGGLLWLRFPRSRAKRHGCVLSVRSASGFMLGILEMGKFPVGIPEILGSLI